MGIIWLIIVQTSILCAQKLACLLVSINHVVLNVLKYAVHAHFHVNGNAGITNVQRNVAKCVIG